MGYFTGVLQTVLPVLLVLMIGVICRSKSILSREGIDTLKKVAVNITLPAVLLKAFATTSYSWKNILIPLFMFAACILGWALGKIVGHLLGKGNAFLPYLTTGFEAGMLGYTLYMMLCGEKYLAAFALVDLGQVLFVFTMYKALLNAEFSDETKKGELLKSMLTSPIILAILAGVLIGASGCYDWLKAAGGSGVFDTCITFLAAPTSVLILISIGYDLVLGDIPWKKVLQAVAARFVIMMILMGLLLLGFGRLFEGDTHLLKAVVVMFILPPPYVLPVFAGDESQYTYLSSTLTIYTLLSIGCFAVLACIA